MKKLFALALCAVLALFAVTALAESIWAPWTESVALEGVFATPQGNLPTIQVSLKGTPSGKIPPYLKVGNFHGRLAGVVNGYNVADNLGKYSVESTVTWLDEQTEVLVGGDAEQLFALVLTDLKVSKDGATAVRTLKEGLLRQAIRENRATKVATWYFVGGLTADQYAIVADDGRLFWVLVPTGTGTPNKVSRKSSNSSGNGGNGGSSTTPTDPEKPADQANRPDPQYDEIVLPPWDEPTTASTSSGATVVETTTTPVAQEPTTDSGAKNAPDPEYDEIVLPW